MRRRPGAIVVVEQYHAPLQAAYSNIRSELAREATNSDCLRMAVFAVIPTVGPEGLCPMLLVLGTITRPARTRSSLSQVGRARTIESAMSEVEKEKGRRRIPFGLRRRGGPKAVEISADLRYLPAGSPVYEYRTKLKRWGWTHAICQRKWGDVCCTKSFRT